MKIERDRAIAALLTLIAMIGGVFGFLYLISLTHGWIVIVIALIVAFAWIYSSMGE